MNKLKANAYYELCKPRITKLILFTTAFGYFLALGKFQNPTLLFFALLGTGLTCSGASALNHYLERDYDGKMKRTSNRPLPLGTLQPQDALGFGLLLVLIGTIVLVTTVNLLTGFLALLTAFLYVLVYTPLKRLTWLNTFIGAIPGALPTLGGWTAATGEIGIGAWILFSIMFFWQIPHFYSISWMYKEDYIKAGYKMITSYDPTGKKTFSQSIIFAVLLVFASLMPVLFYGSGTLYLVTASLLGIVLLSFCVAGYYSRTFQSARMQLRSTIIYLPLLYIALFADRLI